MRLARFICVVVAIVVINNVFCFGQIPDGYYDPAIGKTGVDLQLSLYGIVSNHTAVSYTPGVWNAFYTTDVKENGEVWDMYSDVPGGNPPYSYTLGTNQCGTSTQEGDCYSREHAFCQSYFNGEAPMFTDLHHIFPVDQYVNATGHNNYPFGMVASADYTSLNGSKRGDCTFPGYTGTAFEPIDEYKGDFARAYFYMATRYQHLIGGWENNIGEADAILNGTSYPAYEVWFLNLLLTWHDDDPVSAKEINRNNAVYAIQNNRNPYIDHPEYVEAVWTPGGLKAEPSNHPTGFVSTAGVPASERIILEWNDATGAVLPDGYLIMGSNISYDDISNPVDGTHIVDGGLIKNRSYGTENYTYEGLSANTTYYFKIFPYTNAGDAIDYKTDGAIQTTTFATIQGTTVLQPGDIAFIGYQTVNPDKFAFVLLKDVNEFTEIAFTDNAFDGSGLLNTEETGVWTVPSGGLNKGTVVVIEGANVLTGGGTMSHGLTGLSQSGDQILAYQGTASNPSFIAGISTTEWIETGAVSSNKSYLPTELELYYTACGFENEIHNGVFTGSLTLSANTAKSFINSPGSWQRDDLIQPFPAWLFNVGLVTIIDANTTVKRVILGEGEELNVTNGAVLNITGESAPIQ